MLDGENGWEGGGGRGVGKLVGRVEAVGGREIGREAGGGRVGGKLVGRVVEAGWG